MTLQIFAAFVSDREPPKTVKSCAKTKTRRPSTRTLPATTPSPGIWFDSAAMPKSRQFWTTNGSISSKDPGSPSSSTRSWAESFPPAFCFFRRSSPPPRREAARSSASLSSFESMVFTSPLFSPLASPPSQRDLLLFGQHPLRLPEHLGVVDALAPDRRRVLREQGLDLVVQRPLPVPVERENRLPSRAAARRATRSSRGLRPANGAPRTPPGRESANPRGPWRGRISEDRSPPTILQIDQPRARDLRRRRRRGPHRLRAPAPGRPRRGLPRAPDDRRLERFGGGSPPARRISEERGTAARIRRGREALLIARGGDGPEALREVVRDAARRAGGSPFFKARPKEAPPPAAALEAGEEERTAALAAAIARAFPDPRGLSVSLSIARVRVTRAVVTSRALRPLRVGVASRRHGSHPARRRHATVRLPVGRGVRQRRRTRSRARSPRPRGPSPPPRRPPGAWTSSSPPPPPPSSGTRSSAIRSRPREASTGRSSRACRTPWSGRRVSSSRPTRRGGTCRGASTTTTRGRPRVPCPSSRTAASRGS